MDEPSTEIDAAALVGATLAGLLAWAVAPRPVAPALALIVAHALLLGSLAVTGRERTLSLLGIATTATLGAALWMGVQIGGRPLFGRAPEIGVVCLGVASVAAAVRAAFVSVGRRAASGQLSEASTGVDRLRYWGAMLAYLWATGPGERYDTPAERLLIVVTAVAIVLAVHLLAAVLSVGTGFGALFSLALFLAVVHGAELVASPWRLFDDPGQPAPLATLAAVSGGRARPADVRRRLLGRASIATGGGPGASAEDGPSPTATTGGDASADDPETAATDEPGTATDQPDADTDADTDTAEDDGGTTGSDDRECRNCGCGDDDRLVERALVPEAADPTLIDLCVDCDDARRGRGDDCEAAGRIDRDRVLAATGGRCADCGADDDLEAHAVVPLSDRGHRHPWNVLPLCPDCHESAHADGPRT